MLDMLKDHGPQVAQAIFDTKTTAAAVITTAGAATVATVETSSAMLTLNEWSMMAVIFSATATGIVMVFKAISEFLKIRRELKNKDD